MVEFSDGCGEFCRRYNSEIGLSGSSVFEYVRYTLVSQTDLYNSGSIQFLFDYLFIVPTTCILTWYYFVISTGHIYSSDSSGTAGRKTSD